MERRTRVRAYLTLLLVLFCLGMLAFTVTKKLMDIGGSEGLRDYADSVGGPGWLFAVGLQVVQILVAFIPGELVESGLGFAFGPVYGTVYCYLGLLIGQAVVFLIIRRYGMNALKYFIRPEKLTGIKVLKNEEKLKKLAFILFLLPGTPKDLFCYFFPLTDISMRHFLFASLVARFPSVISSTLGGNMLADGDLRAAAILYAVTGTMSLMGMWLYSHKMKSKTP